jgi:hypothetical protein
MKTDSFFHRFFREFIEAFFTLIGEDERKAARYGFISVEVKEQEIEKCWSLCFLMSKSPGFIKRWLRKSSKSSPQYRAGK